MTLQVNGEKKRRATTSKRRKSSRSRGLSEAKIKAVAKASNVLKGLANMGASSRNLQIPKFGNNKTGGSSSSLVDSRKLGEALLVAAQAGDLKKVKKLLVQGVDVNYAGKKGAYTALIKACRMQRVDVAKTLLDMGADASKASRNGWTALIEAARTGHGELTQLLINEGCDLNQAVRMMEIRHHHA